MHAVMGMKTPRKGCTRHDMNRIRQNKRTEQAT